MPNQALAFHCVSERVYELAGLRTGSIRDQLLRSTLVVQCLIDEGIVDRARPLLVFGAGAAGVNAALTAAKRGVSADVLERTGHEFATLLQSDWRRVDPVEYDWPHPHCRDGCFPSGGRGIPLVQLAGTGADLAHAWDAELRVWMKTRSGRKGLGSVRVIPNQDANDFLNFRVDPARRTVDVTGPWVGKGGAFSTERYGAILSCIGFSGERTSSTDTPNPWSDYVGPGFWTDNDGLGRSNPLRRQYRHVVITGGGDGAMQDFQRAVAGTFGMELLDRVGHSLPGWKKTDHFLDGGSLADLLMAEDAGRRAHAWKRDHQPLVRALRHWHRTFSGAVDALVAPWSDAQVAQTLKSILEPSVWNGNRSVTWVYRDETPGYAYALNRFLCLLIEKLVERRAASGIRLPVSILSESQVTSIRPVLSKHQCGIADDCNGEDHIVEIRTRLSPKPRQVTADLIVVRHGALHDRVLAKQAPVPEQLTPYSFPE